MSEPLDINVLLAKSDTAIFNRIRKNYKHPLFDALPVVKQTSYRLRHKSSLLPRVNTYALLNKREVKMVGYWPSSFFALLWTETKSRSMKMQKKNEANIQPS